jgi:hypothetical protein
LRGAGSLLRNASTRLMVIRSPGQPALAVDLQRLFG